MFTRIVAVEHGRAQWHMVCPTCDMPLRFDHVLRVLPDGMLERQTDLFTAGLQLHLRLCEAGPR